MDCEVKSSSKDQRKISIRRNFYPQDNTILLNEKTTKELEKAEGIEF
jgi:hypothetical protein